MTSDSARIKKLEDTLLSHLADLSNYHVGHPQYTIISHRIEIYAIEYEQLVGHKFTVSKKAIVEGERK